MMSRIHYLLIYVLLGVAFFGPVALAQTDKQLVAAVDANEAQRWREDLRYMSEEMPKQHRNLFHTMTQQQFQNAVSKLNERIPSLARHQIIVEMTRIVAMVGDGHSNKGAAKYGWRDPYFRSSRPTRNRSLGVYIVTG
jgi:ABC-type xylose transport system substrate-binding protein